MNPHQFAPQPKEVRNELHAAWSELAHVREFERALVKHAVELKLAWGEASISELLKFANQWQAENGVLPDSGIRCT